MLDRRQIHTVIDTLIREARIRSVSDIHITEGMPVWYRIHGCLTQARDVLKEYDIREVLLGMMNESKESSSKMVRMWILPGRPRMAVASE